MIEIQRKSYERHSQICVTRTSLFTQICEHVIMLNKVYKDPIGCLEGSISKFLHQYYAASTQIDNYKTQSVTLCINLLSPQWSCKFGEQNPRAHINLTNHLSKHLLTRLLENIIVYSTKILIQKAISSLELL